MPEKRRGTEPQQQGPLLGTAVATVASSDDPGVRPPPGPRSLAPPLSAEEVALGDSNDGGDVGGCTAEALVRIGVWPGKEAAIAGLDAQIQSMTEELQRRRGGPLEEAEAGVPGEQWHEEAIKRAVVERGWHFQKVKIDSTNAKAVDLRQVLMSGSYLVICVTNNRWYKGAKARIKYPDYPADAPATSATVHCHHRWPCPRRSCR